MRTTRPLTHTTNPNPKMSAHEVIDLTGDEPHSHDIEEYATDVQEFDSSSDSEDSTADEEDAFFCLICLEMKKKVVACSHDHKACRACFRRYRKALGREARERCCCYAFCDGSY